GTPNAMNAAWGGQWDYEEIIISLGSHATTDNLNRCGDFTVAFATRDTLTAADYVGMVSHRKDTDKMEITGGRSTKAENVEAPVFDCFPMTMECRIKEKIHESETGFYMVAEIVNIVCDERYLASDGKPDVEKMNLITFDPIHNGYIALGERAGAAFHDGLSLKK
ncbi:MAG: flavin reductase, partial [Muribaculaceae bacterium]|nr:flavin reductase [Muribaculaceae bacterium]